MYCTGAATCDSIKQTETVPYSTGAGSGNLGGAGSGNLGWFSFLKDSELGP